MLWSVKAVLTLKGAPLTSNGLDDTHYNPPPDVDECKNIEGFDQTQNRKH